MRRGRKGVSSLLSKFDTKQVWNSSRNAARTGLSGSAILTASFSRTGPTWTQRKLSGVDSPIVEELLIQC